MRHAGRVAWLTVATAAVLAVAAACGGQGGAGSDGSGTPPPAATTADHNDADIRFLHTMIAYHQQAIDMATAAETRGNAVDVQAVAGRIRRAQRSELDKMREWLAAWGAPEPSVQPPAPGNGRPGYISEREMAELLAASGTNFDRIFLELMIRHHEGAVAAAQEEQKVGRNVGAKALANAIEQDQTAEITEMRALLGE